MKRKQRRSKPRKPRRRIDQMDPTTKVHKSREDYDRKDKQTAIEESLADAEDQLEEDIRYIEDILGEF